jgi:preprotein translocase subunit SecG
MLIIIEYKMNTRIGLFIVLSLFLILCFILRMMYNYDNYDNNKHNTT